MRSPLRIALGVGVLACALASTAARGEAPALVTMWNPHPGERKPLSPDARRFLAPSPFAHWAGTERVLDGELSIATPRPLSGDGFLPALDDHLSTTSYLGLSSAYVPALRASWNALELASLHDLDGGAVLGTSFRVDARAQTAVQASATLALPLPRRLWLVPSIGVGAHTVFAPELQVATEVRSDRGKPLGYSAGIETSSWMYDTARIMARAGAIYRVTPAVALEQRLALGMWDGPRLRGSLAVRWISAALLSLGAHAALYERVTLTRGPVFPVDGTRPERAALSSDVAIGFRRAFGASYGIVLEVDEGAQEGGYPRWGADLTLYAVLF
jgi:hypothetical protein